MTVIVDVIVTVFVGVTDGVSVAVLVCDGGGTDGVGVTVTVGDGVIVGVISILYTLIVNDSLIPTATLYAFGLEHSSSSSNPAPNIYPYKYKYPSFGHEFNLPEICTVVKFVSLS